MNKFKRFECAEEPVRWLSAGTYLFTVQASSLDIKAAGYQQKSARHVVTVDVVEAPSVPYVAITSPRVKVNPSTRLVLSGVVDGSAPQVAHLLAADGQARWTIVDGPLTTGEVSDCRCFVWWMSDWYVV
jgi:hypothetical protein